MVIDRVGVLIFPEVLAFRIIGRIGFPIFAFLIAEGAKHTKNKLRHVLVMGGFAAVIQIVYFIFTRDLQMSVLITFTMSLLIIYALDHLKNCLFEEKRSAKRIALAACLFFGTLLIIYAVTRKIDVDYGFAGCLLPVFPALFTTPRVKAPPTVFKTVDTKTFRVLAIGIGALSLSLSAMTSSLYVGLVQLTSVLSVPLLLLYSEKRGRLKMKYFFYVFYPLHLVVIFLLGMLLRV